MEVDIHLGSGVQAMVCFFAPLWAKTLIFEDKEGCKKKNVFQKPPFCTGGVVFFGPKIRGPRLMPSGAASTHPIEFGSQGGPKMGPSWLQVEARVQRRTLQKQAFRIGGVSKIKVSGNNSGTKETNFRA